MALCDRLADRAAASDRAGVGAPVRFEIPELKGFIFPAARA